MMRMRLCMFVVATPTTTAADLRLGHELSAFARVEGEISVDLADSYTCVAHVLERFEL